MIESAQQLATRLAERAETVPTSNGGRWTAPCPAHDDGNPSLVVVDGDRGPVAVCMAGCTAEAVSAAS